MELVNHRKKALAKLGPIPKKNGKGGFQARVDWYINLEVLLQSILELGQKSKDLNSEVLFSRLSKIFFDCSHQQLVCSS